MEENNLSKRSRAAYAGLSCVLFAAVMLSGSQDRWEYRECRQ